MKRVLSGIKSSGEVTLGNYLGAMKRWARDQDEYENFYFIPDLHVLNVDKFQKNPKELTRLTLESLAWLLASGVSPEKSTIYLQSSLPSHSELSWILENYVYTGELNRMVQFKEKTRNSGDESVPAALYTYPILMAADILLYDIDEVPVGEDQRQHVELARTVARRFNNLYGETFKVPKGTVPEVAARVMNLQHPKNKMSKSDTDNSGNILLKDDIKTIEKKIMRAVTDSESEVYYDKENKPGISNLIEIYSGLQDATIQEAEKELETLSYKELKEKVTKAAIAELKPIKENYKEIIQNEDKLVSVLREGKRKAGQISEGKLQQVKDKIGIFTLHN